MHGGYADMLRKLEAKVSAWKMLSISLTTVCLVSVAFLICWLRPGNSDMAPVAAMILFPLCASVPFMIRHWRKLDIKKDALAHYVQNADRASEIFYQLLEMHISGGIGRFFGKIGLTDIKATFYPFGNNAPDITVSARKGKCFIYAVFIRTSFSLDVDEDEEWDERKAIRYPGSDSLAELSDLIGAEIDKRNKKKKNGRS